MFSIEKKVGNMMWIKKRKLIDCLFWGFLGFFLLMWMQRMGLGPKKMLVMSIVVVLAVSIHIRRLKRTPKYIQKILGIENESGKESGIGRKRIYEYDWLRLMAVVMVITTHAIQMDMDSGMVPEGRVFYWMTVLYVFCLVCNLLYVMLSGALLLPYKENKLWDFYLYRMEKIVSPMLVYFIFYLWINGELEHINFYTVGWVLRRFFMGDTSESPHYWLMYVILGLYVVIPFFRYMCRNIPYKTLTAMVAVSGICMYFTTYSPIPCAVTPLLSSWIGVAIAGYWIAQKETRSYDGPIMAMGGVSIFITMYCIHTYSREEFLNICCNCSPTMLMIAMSLFSLVFSIPRFFSKGNVFLRILSRYSFSIILIHWYVLFFVTRAVFRIDVSQYFYIGGILLSLIVTLLVSFGIAFLIDNLVVTVVETMYGLLINKGKNLALFMVRKINMQK